MVLQKYKIEIVLELVFIILWLFLQIIISSINNYNFQITIADIL